MTIRRRTLLGLVGFCAVGLSVGGSVTDSDVLASIGFVVISVWCVVALVLLNREINKPSS